MRISRQLGPRVVVLVTTVDREGRENVMTVSFVMPISFDPKYLAFSISPQRHSFKNLKEVPEFTINILERGMLKEARICGSYSGRDSDKFELAGLTKERPKKLRPPFIKETPISLGCRVEQLKKFGDHFLVVGRVLEERVRKETFSPLLHSSGGLFMKGEEIK